MSSLATSSGAPFRRFASGFGRFAAVLSVLGLLLAVALSVPSSWFALDRGSHEPAPEPTYQPMTPAAPVRVAVGGVSGVQLLAPLVASNVAPRQALVEPPDDAPLVGWWSGSAKAGASHGQTILVAHAAQSGGGLTQISRLSKGDLVELLTREGSMRYQVSSVRVLDPAAMDRAGITLFKQDGGAGRLVLLSAEGWDGSAYQHTVVVTAAPLGRPVP